jgi:hypothetical protein
MTQAYIEKLLAVRQPTEICLAFAVAQGLKDGYEVMFVTDDQKQRIPQ